MKGVIDIFDFHQRIMGRYESFASSFLDVDDPQIERALTDTGRLKSMCPEPLIQFNPSYEPGASVEDLVGQGVLTPAMSGETPSTVPKLPLAAAAEASFSAAA